ncbi:MAG: hypothetical protein Q4P71_01040 [Actinomycetaceae bacterium]|nr:hypothetical protein [Actinomycetaceae bacterium]
MVDDADAVADRDIVENRGCGGLSTIHGVAGGFDGKNLQREGRSAVAVRVAPVVGYYDHCLDPGADCVD